MNCNTTHYRANSSSVPGDPTYGAREGAGTDVTPDQAKGIPTPAQVSKVRHPLILYKDPNGEWTAANGGYDPQDDQEGEIYSLSVVKTEQGYAGWASGRFGTGATISSLAPQAGSVTGKLPLGAPTAFLRLDPARSEWNPDAGGPGAGDYPPSPTSGVLTLRDHEGGEGPSFMSPAIDPNRPDNPMLTSDPEHDGWRVFGTPFSMVPRSYSALVRGSVSALASDNHGGMWLAAKPWQADSTWFYHYTDRPPEPVFEDVSHPIREQATVAAGSPDGSLWVATGSNVLYRHDRVRGWDSVAVRGWDPGRVVTQTSPVLALAFGQDGRGVAVGKGGRIADLTARTARLDDAAGRVCAVVGAPPCGTGYDLRAAAFGPDGSVLIGGDRRTMLYRVPGGDFHAISRPDAATTAAITAISYPAVGQAWLTTSTGEVFGGALTDPQTGNWTWKRESLDESEVTLTASEGGQPQPLRAIALRPDGSGYAVGDEGVMLERTAGPVGAINGVSPWRRVDSGYTVNFDSIAMDSQAKGMLIGANDGLVLTLLGGRWEIAHGNDVYDPLTAPDFQGNVAKTVGVALVAGTRPGEVEAWAVTQLRGATTRGPGVGPTSVLHYASDPADPLLNADSRVQPLPDAPDPREGEISLAAFGRTDCQLSTVLLTTDQACPEPTGSNLINDVISQRVTADLTTHAGQAGAPGFAVFTGDVDDVAGTSAGNPANTPADQSVIHHRFAELVADPLLEAGVPLFAALGGQDLSHTEVCPPVLPQYLCNSTHRTRTGTNLAWQAALGGQPAPFGDAPPATGDGLSFVPVGSVAADGNAQTHYAFDVQRDGTDVSRVAVLDTSLKTLTDATGVQNPRADQATWLRSVLCRTGETASATTRCSRGAAEPAIVVSNTPTYSYGPGGLTDTQSDGSSMEAILLQYDVSAVVSGRLGWNGRYWTTAAGLHCPAPGAAYVPDTEAPQAGDSCVGQATGGAADPNDAVDQATRAASKVTGALASLGAPAGPVDTGVDAAPHPAVLPVVVAASAGGPFGPAGVDSGTATAGYWHGYSVVRVPADGDPRKLIVEQRPVFDWLSLQGTTHIVRPGQHLKLQGEGREAPGIDAQLRYDTLDAPAITHRYDLIEADPAHPYLPKIDPASPEPHHYVRLDPSVGSIDPFTGTVRAGSGNHPRVFALAVLSAGSLAASYPLAFEPRRSYVPPQPPRLVVPQLPQIQVLGFNAQSISAPTAGTPPPPAPPINTTLNLPQPPAIPTFPSAAPNPVSPLAPPAPPAPPSNHQPTALDITVGAVGVTVPPTTGVTAQPTPPVNPSPPSGARREAKQRQAATAKSEEGASEGAREGAGDPVDGPPGPGHAFARRDRIRAMADGFTPLSHPRMQPSAWTTVLEWGGGVGLMALALAFGFVTVRPTPRRGPPVVALALARREKGH